MTEIPMTLSFLFVLHHLFQENAGHLFLCYMLMFPSISPQHGYFIIEIQEYSFYLPGKLLKWSFICECIWLLVFENITANIIATMMKTTTPMIDPKY